MRIIPRNPRNLRTWKSGVMVHPEPSAEDRVRQGDAELET